jgi:ATP phosphoribosyltransferase
VKEISTDCDRDAVLVKVEAQGPGVCHEGYQSCFFRRLESARVEGREPRAYDPESRLRRQGVKLKLGIPKGSLENATIDLFRRAGIQSPPAAGRISRHRRSGNRVHADPRAGNGALRGRRHSRRRPHRPRLGGRKRRQVVAVADLIYAKQSFGKVRWVLAVPEASPSSRVKDLEGKIIATELVETTKRYLAQRRDGESGVQLGRDGSEAAGAGRRHRGSHRNRLVAARQQAAIIDTVIESNTQLIANRIRGRTQPSGASWKT